MKRIQPAAYELKVKLVLAMLRRGRDSNERLFFDSLLPNTGHVIFHGFIDALMKHPSADFDRIPTDKVIHPVF